MIFSHLGICVANIEQSKRFYTRALGFECWAEFAAGEEVRAQHGNLAGLEIRAHFMRRDGTQIELLEFVHPEPMGEPAPPPMHQLGMTHLAVLVDDIEAAMARIVEHGGRVLEETRCSYKASDGAFRDAVFCTDPNGVRIELMYLPGSGWDEAISVGRSRR